MAKLSNTSMEKSVAAPGVGKALTPVIGEAAKKLLKPLLPWKEMEDHAQQFIGMLRRNATLREVRSIKPMDGLTLITLIGLIEQGDRKKALQIMQSAGGKKQLPKGGRVRWIEGPKSVRRQSSSQGVGLLIGNW